MKTYMPLNGLRWSRNSGSANCDMPQSAVFGRPGGGNCGRNLKARGIMSVRRFQCSTITIGDNCTFNSSSRFNARGINHRCILETGKPGAVLVIGNRCGFSGCSIVADKEVVIGNHVMVGANTCIGDRDDHPG